MKYSLTEKILFFLADCEDQGEFMMQKNWLQAMLLEIPHSHKNWYFMKRYIDDRKKRKKVYTIIAGFKRRGYLQRKKFSNSYGYILTPKAKTKISRLNSKDVSIKKLPPDQQLMVFFDIPESLRSSRDTLRKFLKEFGFEQLQKSIWISSYEATSEIKKFLNELRISEYVQLLIVRPITH